MGDSDGGGKKVVESEDFEEEEVWEMMSTREGSKTRSKSNEDGRVSSAWRVNGTGGRAAGHQSSAAVDIPDSCKTVKRRSTKETEVCCHKDEDEEEEEKVPPHEYLARRVEMSRIASSHSMCEGIGRTLKGRDLSTMRDAILTKTGYIE